MTIGSAFSAGPFAVAQAQEASGQQIVITLDQAREAARRAVQAGEFAIAEELANGLLQANPNDADALIIIAVSAQAGQQYVRQADFAGRAFQEAETDIQRFEAAMLSAQAYFALGRYGWSQVWLRLASENAPNEETLDLVRSNYAQAARVNPWRNRFTFSISPSSNVNNGSRDRILEIGGLPFTLSADARALAGVRARIGFNTRYRYAQTQISESYLRFGFFLERVRLTDEAKEEAPDAEGNDFAFDAIEIGWGHIRAAGSGGTHQVDLAGGKNWYGGRPLSDFVRASYRRALPVSDRQLLGASFSLEEQWRLDAPVRSATTARGGLDWTQRRGNGDTWTVLGGLRRVASDSPEIDHTAARVAVSYLIGRQIGPTRWDLEADVEVRDYPENPFDPSGREDLRWRVGATVGFPDAELYGYFPTLTVEARRVDSNVSLYNIEEVGFRVGVRSIF
ncbi:MAG: hypothetical protein HRU32_08035 [Rhodobacteraceae bacterium]|nr:hypothetical protein [Paracoccaceae bacterium]